MYSYGAVVSLDTCATKSLLTKMQSQLIIRAFSLISGCLELDFNQDCDIFLTLQVRIRRNEINRNTFKVTTNIAILL